MNCIHRVCELELEEFRRFHKVPTSAETMTPVYVQASSRSEARATAVVLASSLQPAITLLSPVTTNPASPSHTKVDIT